MSRDARIARLPECIRREVNRHLEKVETGQQIADWLNTLPEVNALMAAEFDGQPIIEANVVTWELGGYGNWKAHQEALEAAVQFGEDAAEITKAAGGQLADHLALCLTARMAVVLREPPSEGDDTGMQLQRLRQLCADVVALRKGDHNAQWLRIEREKLDSELREFEEQETARKRQMEKPEIDFKTYHAPKEVHDQMAAMLKRL